MLKRNCQGRRLSLTIPFWEQAHSAGDQKYHARREQPRHHYAHGPKPKRLAEVICSNYPADSR
jgi:hypothetical protein